MPTTRMHTAWLEDHFDGTDPIDFEIATAGTFKLAFFTSSATINADTTDLYGTAPLDANEVSGTGYSAGGLSLSNFTVDLTTGTLTVDCDDPAEVAQSGSGFSDARTAVLYEFSSNKVIWSQTEDFDFGNVTGPLNYAFNASGVFTV